MKILIYMNIYIYMLYLYIIFEIDMQLLTDDLQL